MNNESIANQLASPTDGELLHELMSYLTSFAGTLGLITDNMREFAPFVVLEDGTQTDLAPVDALDNATKGLAAKCMDIGTRRAMRGPQAGDMAGFVGHTNPGE
ncbi:hypothetical protein IAD21_03710 [Abditibacteriota bacterium]|nr:hypothetical protein IAD21_03710 [Abditibacteriota bacterium]